MMLPEEGKKMLIFTTTVMADARIELQIGARPGRASSPSA